MLKSNIEQPYNLIQVEQRSPEWKEFRKGKIGSSDVAAVLGLSPWETKLEAWERILLGEEKIPNENMKRGTQLEADALNWFNCNHSKDRLDYKPAVLQSKEHPDLIASLDGWMENSILEIKCPKKISREVPEYYNAQMQHQMYIANARHCYYMQYDGQEGHVREVLRDEEFIKTMVKMEIKFINSIINFDPPEPTNLDWIDEYDADKIVHAHRYKELALLIDELETEKEHIRSILLADNKHPRIRCADLKIQKVMRKGNIDYNKILIDYEILDLEEYRKPPIATWRIT